MEKHNLFYELLESLQKHQCSACFYMQNSISRYFDNILYESVMDSGFIANFRKNEGFCNDHAYKFLSYKDGLATARLYYYLSQDININLKKENRIGYGFRKHYGCQICDFIQSTEEIIIDAIGEYLFEPEYENAFKSSYCLCYPHYMRLIKASKRKLPKWLIDFHNLKFDEITEKLKSYLDFQNFSLGDKRPQLTYEEQLIYQEAVRFFSGYEGMKTK
ncbi:MAG: hypothetical protein HPY53_02645 [Brevinematales bacterium]|nr:hypothetical protein [Brevinematales bacterium]